MWKHIILVMMAWGGSTQSNLSAQGYLWTKQVGLSGPATGYKIALDGSNHVFVTGGFQETANFGQTNLTSVGGHDIFIAEFDTNGSPIWVKQAGGSGEDIGNDAAIDSAGNVYVIGSFQGTATFDQSVLTATGTVTGGPVNNVFIAKYDSSGNLIWVRKSGGGGTSVGLGIAVDGNGNAHSTGYYQNFSLRYSIVIDKWDTDGSPVWHQELPGNPNYQWVNAGNSIKVDSDGNSYVTGQFGTQVTFGSTTLTTPSNFGETMFITKLDSNGNFLWAKQAGSSVFDTGASIAIDGSGNSLVTGAFGEALNFGSTNLTTSSSQGVDCYAAKYDGNGNLLWARQITRFGKNSGNGIATDTHGNCYVTGYSEPSQVFIRKLDSDGNSVWGFSPNHTGYSSGYGVAVDSSDTSYLLSWTTGNIAFDNLSFTNLQGGDVFLSALSERVPPLFITQPRSSNPGFPAGQDYTFFSSVRSVYPVSFQWEREEVTLSGETNASLTITNAQVPNMGSYRVIASNMFGAVTSVVANLAVYYSVSLTTNGTGSISVSPSVTSYLGNSTVVLTASTNSGFEFTGWSGDLSGTNNPASLTVTTNLSITAIFSDSVTNIVIDDTDSRAAFDGTWSTGSFLGMMYGTDFLYSGCATSVTATATYRPTIIVPGFYDVFIWCPAGFGFSSKSPWSVFSSGGSVTTNVDQRTRVSGWRLIVPGTYFEAGTNGYVSLSNATAEPSSTVVAADAVRFFPSMPPAIVTSPQTQTAATGADVTFNVTVTGTPPFSYQWQFNGTNIANGTASNLTIARVQPSNGGNYSVTVSNIIDAVTSSNALLVVVPPASPRINSPSFNTAGQFQMTLSGDAGVTFTIETSADLADWTPLTNILNATGVVMFADTVNTNSAVRFYRARWSQ